VPARIWLYLNTKQLVLAFFYGSLYHRQSVFFGTKTDR
jgi:hypothetical protein